MQVEGDVGRYGITIRETLKRTIIVDAIDLDDAIKKVEAAVERDELLLELDDFEEREIAASEYWKGGRILDDEDVSFYQHLDSELVRISLKALYENGHRFLDIGGKIVHNEESGSYELYQDGVNENLLLSDGEYVDVLQELPTSVLVESPITLCKVWFTPEEFKIAALSKPI